jgi:uncharacterized protein (DUF2147 family)
MIYELGKKNVNAGPRKPLVMALQKSDLSVCRPRLRRNPYGLPIRYTISILTTLLGAPSALAQTAGEPTGIWLTQAGDARVRVTKCGGGICGVIVGLKQPIDPATGKPQVDDKNPNPQLAKRPIVGLQLFIGMKSQGPGKWSGRIYNDGKSYISNVTLADPIKLKVEGCVGVLCGGEMWSRSHR